MAEKLDEKHDERIIAYAAYTRDEQESEIVDWLAIQPDSVVAAIYPWIADMASSLFCGLPAQDLKYLDGRPREIRAREWPGRLWWRSRDRWWHVRGAWVGLRKGWRRPPLHMKP